MGRRTGYERNQDGAVAKCVDRERGGSCYGIVLVKGGIRVKRP